MLKIAHFTQNTDLSLIKNLNFWLNHNKNSSSVFYNNVNLGKKDNYFFLETSVAISIVLKKIYQNFTKRKISNFSFFKQGILNSEILKILTKYDIAHLHWVNNFLSMNNLKLITRNMPTVITIHDFQLLFGGCHFTEGCKNYLNECVKCPQLKSEIQSIANKNFLEKKRILNNKNIYFVHHNKKSLDYGKKIFLDANHEIIDCTVNTSIFKPLENIDKIKKKYNLPKLSKVILASANYNCATKNLDLFPKIISKLGENVKLILIGKGFDHFDIKSKKVLHLGFVQNPKMINELYNISDLVFSISKEETVPGIACEALSAGSPFVGFSGVGNLDKMIENNKNGFIIKNFSFDELMDVLNTKTIAESKKSIRDNYLQSIDNFFYSKYLKVYAHAFSKFKRKQNIGDFDQMFDDLLSYHFHFKTFPRYLKNLTFYFLIISFQNRFIKKIWLNLFSNRLRFFLKNKFLNLFNKIS